MSESRRRSAKTWENPVRQIPTATGTIVQPVGVETRVTEEVPGDPRIIDES
ncbi:hypothetical protein H2201_009229 [Coniosporium apollinis]|uniref:Uncharacterized protein n=1 Tax=Coniosporium apollinis TaxID=61459 RepID=A0ABQ9NF25_9PEZI|nr:hypothetical protein H2201_009229 [Coniosporium apollinis]